MRNYSSGNSQNIFNWCRNGDMNSIRRALDTGLDINMIDPVTTDSPLMMACRHGHTEIVRLCLNYGAKNDPHPDFGQTALHAAVSGAHFNAAKVLLETADAAGAVLDIIDLEDSHGQTPLHAASSIGATNVVELLLSYNAKISRIDAHAQTSLHLCGGSGNQECVAMLLDHGGDELLESLDVSGNTVLHHASFNGHAECVRLLLETAANVHARNHKGQTAFQLASSRSHHQILQLLTLYGGDQPVVPQHNRNLSEGGHRHHNTAYVSSAMSGPPQLVRSLSTPVKLAQGPPLQPQHHQRHISDSSLPATPPAQSQLGLALPRPHTMTSPSGVAANRNGQVRYPQSLSGRSEPSTPDSNGYVTAHNSEVKSGYRVLARPSAQDEYMSSPSFVRSSAVLASSSMEDRHSQASSELPGFAGVPVFTKQPIIQREAFSPPGQLPHSHRSRLAGGWMGPNTDQYTLQMDNANFGTPPIGSRLCDSPQHDPSEHLLIGTYDSPAKPALPHSHAYRSPSPKKQPAAVDQSSSSEFADPLEVFEAAGRRWHAYESEEGDVYFLDMAASHSQWEDPRLHGLVDHNSSSEAQSESQATSPQRGTATSPLRPHYPPKSPSPKAAEKTRNFGYSSDEGESAGRKTAVAPSKINWQGELSMADDEALPRAPPQVSNLAAKFGGSVLPRSDAAKLSFQADANTAPRRNAEDSSDFSRKVQSIQASRGFSMAEELARDQTAAGRGTQQSSADAASLESTSGAHQSASSSAVCDADLDAKCEQYLSVVRGGGSLQALREAMEEQREAQSLMLRVFVLADELLMDRAALSPASPISGQGSLEAASGNSSKESMETLRSDAVLGRYAKMAGMGVPAGNVLAKMRMDEVPLSQRNRLMGALGHELENQQDKLGRKSSTGSFQSLHWNPLPADKLKNTIWSLGGGGAGDLAESLMAETEMAELEKLFCSAATASLAATAAAPAKDVAREADQLRVLERKRAQNVAIGLVPFRVFGSHMDLLKAICSLDTLGGKLTADHLDNFRGLLPTEAELKRAQDLAGSKHPAELFMQAALMFFPELPRRLHCFATCLSFGAACEALTAKMTRIINCCNQVLSSSRLAKLLQRMLAVGNVMNQGTERGQAAGFTLDSLLKMVDTKGVDRRTSVLDYVVRSLYDKGEERTLDVIDDLQAVDEAAKLSGTDALREFDAVQRNLALLRSEQERNQDTLANSSFSSPTAKAIVSHFHSRLEAFLEDFAALSGKLQRWRDVLGRKIPELLRYFGEDAASTDVSKIFAVLQKFRNALLFCRESTEWKLYRQGAGEQGGATMC